MRNKFGLQTAKQAIELTPVNEQVKHEVPQWLGSKEVFQKVQQRARSVFEEIRDVIYTLSEEGTFASLNLAFETVTGWSRTEWIGKPLQSIVHPDDWPAELALLERMLHGETPPRHEVRVRASSGEYLVAESMVTPQFRDGKFMGVLGIARDITERKQAEEALRIKDFALASSINAIAFADLQDKLFYVNPSFLKLWCYDDKQEVLGRPAVEFWQVPERAEAVFDALRDQGGWVGELVAKRKDGSLFDVQLSASMVKDPMGNPICRIASFVDITEQKRSQQELRQSEQRYRCLVENAPDIVFSLSPEGMLTALNGAFETITGWSRAEWLGKFFGPIIHPDDLPIALARFQSALQGERTPLYELRIRVKTGEYRVGQFTSTPQIEDGKVVSILGIGRDIAERKQAEEELQEHENK